jgi:hypothetical protein
MNAEEENITNGVNGLNGVNVEDAAAMYATYAQNAQNVQNVQNAHELDIYGSEPSDSDFCDESDSHEQHREQSSTTKWVVYNKLSFNQVKKQMNKSYAPDIVHRYSSALDILASYLKGQKFIYMEARHHTVRMLNLLMLPAIFISSLVSVLQVPLINSPHILSALSAFVAFILAIINYLKLDAAAEAHKTSAHQYDKLQNYVEFQSGQILLFSAPLLNNDTLAMEMAHAEDKPTLLDARRLAEDHLIEEVRTKIKTIEEKIADIKGTNQFNIPRLIRRAYPLIFNTNIFAVIKKIDDYRSKTLTDLKHVKNELRYITALQQHLHAQVVPTAHTAPTAQSLPALRMRVTKLFAHKKELINTLLYLNTAFSLIDKLFQKEIDQDLPLLTAHEKHADIITEIMGVEINRHHL